MNEHVELDLLDELALGTLDAAQRPAIETHLAACAICRQAYDEVRRVIDVLPHELEVAAPSDELRERILRAIDAPPSAAPASVAPPSAAPASVAPASVAPSSATASSAAASPRTQALWPERFPLAAALAAALLLALLGDVYLALHVNQNNGGNIAAVTTPQPASPTPPAVATPQPATPTPPAVATPQPATPTPPAVATPQPAIPTPPAVATPQPTRPQPSVTPAPSPRLHRTVPRHGADAEVARIAQLERQLAAAQSTARTDAQQIAQLARELEEARKLAQARAVPPRVAHIIIAPGPHAAPTSAPRPLIADTARPEPIAAASASPSPTPVAAASGVSADDANLIGALRTGKVYAIDGAVDGEPWHLTIVQPRGGGNAVIYSGTPDAPAGQTYRTWVFRGGRTVAIGVLPPATPATLEMPMALEAGDIVAFSREPVGRTNGPTQPFLMQFKITP